MEDLISIRECARRLGVSDTAVHKAIKSERISIAGRTEASNRPLVDFEDVLKKWHANTNANMQRNGSGSGAVSPKSKVANLGGVSSRLEPQPNGGALKRSQTEDADPDAIEEAAKQLENGVIPALNVSRQIKEAYAAKREKLDFEQKAGMLLDRHQVESEQFAIARQVRDAILNVCDRIDAELAALTDAREINLRMRRELIEAMEGLVNAS